MKGIRSDSRVESGGMKHKTKADNQAAGTPRRAVGARPKNSAGRTRRGDTTSSLRDDPQEDDPKLRKIFKSVDKEVETILADLPRQLGYCHAFWDEKRRILKQKYGIRWKSPDEMNPDVIFD